jgi:quercetin dioxygenase-like cupin family protein
VIETVFHWMEGTGKIVDRVIQDDNIHYLHMVFPQGEGLPQHVSNSNVYMTVLRGTLSIGLNDQPVHEYAPGTVLLIAQGTVMNVGNKDPDTLELIVVKAPAPASSGQR